MSFCFPIMQNLWFLILSHLLFSVVYVLAKDNELIEALNQQPEQIHLAFGEKLNDIVVTWSTLDKVDDPLVKYGEGTLNNTAKGESVLFTDPSGSKRNQSIHLVTLKDLKFNTRYDYKVGSAQYGWSSLFWFKTVPEGDDWTVRAVVYGDMGNENARTLPYLHDEATEGIYDFVLHVGDMGYNLLDYYGKRTDAYMKQIEPIAGYLPYMTCPGNHEKYENFTHYKSRFMMPGDRDGMYYSWDAGRVHFISISSEHYYNLDFGTSMVKNQYKWLINDLEKATSKENRKKRPWIILYGHRPMYCTSEKDWQECLHELTRTGLPVIKRYGLEVLLKKYGVDLVIWGHEHSYQRSWPLYNYKVYNGSFEKPYVNPGAPVHIISGSAGCYEGTDKFKDKHVDWLAFRSNDYGYARLNIYNKTHLYFEQVSINDVDEVNVIDSIWIVKDKHEAYHYNDD